MYKKVLIPIILTVGLLLILLISCDKGEKTNDITSSVDHLEMFKPTFDLTIKSGMLVFESRQAFDVTKLEITKAKREAVDLWEESIGFQTPANVFNKVINAEDSINTHYESLPENELEYWRNQPEVHSEIYLKALNTGIIKEITEPDGNEYFDYNLVDKTLAGVVNLEGLVMVEGKIYQYTGNAIKMIVNGDYSCIEKLKNINEFYNNNLLIVAVYEDDNTKIKSTMGVYPPHNWTHTNGWQNVTTRERVIVWIDGHSEWYGTPYDETCSEQLNCTFVVRAEAQKKNIWGNWKYSNNYIPSLTISDATWDYSYSNYACDPYITSGCGSYDCTWYNNIAPYSCSPDPNYMCPTSPFSAYFPTINNAYINLTPHGIWQSYPKFFSEAFWVYGTLNATIDGKSFSYTY